MLIFLLSAALVCAHHLTGASDVCAPRCDVSSCPRVSCPPGSGHVPDRCNCCRVCAPGEGQPCGRANQLPCGEGLECRALGAERRRSSRRVCRCKTQHPVCGSDGKTYGNVCQLRAAGVKDKRRPAVHQTHKGPCSPSGGTPRGQRSTV